MGLFDRDGLTHNGYGDRPYLSGFDAEMSRLDGIGQTTFGGITGTTARDAVERYRATGASEAQVASFIDSIARQHGR